MKTQMISKILLTLTLVFVLGIAITHVDGETQESDASVIDQPNQQFPVVTIHSVASATGVSGSTLTRGQTGVFVLSITPQILLPTTFVNFKVPGPAIPGVYYPQVVPPAFIGQSGFGTILIK